MQERCSICKRPFGKRKRCYYCTSKERTGELLNCKECGGQFYAQKNQLNASPERRPIFCSLKCKHEALKKKTPPWAKQEENILHSSGYVLVWMPEHPRATRGRVLEHILVMEKKLGRSIERGEEVHHIDHNKQNNDPNNLRLLTASEHAKLHHQERKKS